MIGIACFLPGAPTTPDEAVPAVRDKFQELMPDQDPSRQPGGRAVVNLPVIFAAGQATTLDDDTFDLGPYEVVLDVTPTWSWDFDDGGEPETYEVPGGAWPNDDVAHTYTRVGDREVVLTTEWTGTFTVDDIGPFDITGEAITQVSEPMALPVREARGVLTAE